MHRKREMHQNVNKMMCKFYFISTILHFLSCLTVNRQYFYIQGKLYIKKSLESSKREGRIYASHFTCMMKS